MDCLLNARKVISDTYEMDESTLDSIHQIMVKACEPILTAKPVKSKEPATEAKAKAKVVRPKSAYNMFVKDMFRKNKEDGKGKNSQDIMCEVPGMWAKLKEDEKKIYIDMATEANAELNLEDAGKKKAPKEADVSKRRITGYNVFYRENKDTLKESAVRDSLPTMKVVGNAWKALTYDERTNWNTRASAEADGATA